MARYFRYQKSFSAFLVQFYIVGCGQRRNVWIPLILQYVCTDGAVPPLLEASPFATQVKIRYKVVMTSYFRYQSRLSSFLVLFYSVVFARRSDMWLRLRPQYASMHPLFKASPFATQLQITKKHVIARFLGYQRNLSSFLVLFYSVVFARRSDMWQPLRLP